MSQTNQLEVLLTNHLFGGSAFVQPTEWWVSIYQADPGDNPGLAITPELGSRVQITGWTRVNGQATASNALSFSVVPNNTVWTITHWVLWDGASGGTPLVRGAVSAPQTRTEGQNLIIPAGNFIITQE